MYEEVKQRTDSLRKKGKEGKPICQQGILVTQPEQLMDRQEALKKNTANAMGNRKGSAEDGAEGLPVESVEDSPAEQPTAPLSRRHFLQMCATGVAAWSVLGVHAGGAYIGEGMRGPAARTIPFNANWLFGGPALEGSTAPDFDDSAFTNVTLPHTVTELSWREWDPESWEKIWIYRRHFDIPPELEGQRIFVDFGAAMTAATLTLNGRELGEHVGGYLPFSFELTDHLVSGENVLAVELDAHFNINVPPNRLEPHGPRSIDFWQPGGIYRQVSLRAVPQVFLADVFAKPVDVLDSDRRLEVECTLDAAVAPEGSMRVDVELRDGDQTIGMTSAPVTIRETGQTNVNLTLRDLHDVRLWDVDDPQLYDVVVTLSGEEEPIHDYATRVGFREAEFTKQGFFLNGRRLKIFGLNRHQLYPFAGGAMPDRVQRKDAEILKNELNCNMVRCAHYPQAEAFLNACDELGLMAFDEIPGWGRFIGDEQWQARAVRQVGDMVRRGRNHPSIVIWGVRCNETNNDVELWSTARDLAHSLDDSRPTTGAMHGPLYETNEFVQDVFSLNDYWQEDEHAALRPPRTDFPYLISEAVGALTGPSEFYRRDDDPTEIQQGQAMAHTWVHEQSFADDRYCGCIAWIGIDYFSGAFTHYRGAKYNGVVDSFREPKLGAAIYQSQIDPRIRPVIMPAFYWDFSSPKALPLDADGPTGGQAMICSNCARLELFVGGEHYATVHPDTDRFGHLPYPPSFIDFNDVDGSTKPELRIDGYANGEQVHSRRFSSDPSGDVFTVSADDERLTANGSDATRVAFRVLDRYGAPRLYVGDVADTVTIAVDGPGRLVGDSPFAFADTGGVGAVWIRTEHDTPGKIDVTVSHPSYESHTVTIQAAQP